MHDINTLQALLILASKAAIAQPQSAELIYRKAVQTAEVTFGLDHPVIALTLVFLNEHLIEHGQAEEIISNRQRIMNILTVYLNINLLSSPISAEPTESHI